MKLDFQKISKKRLIFYYFIYFIIVIIISIVYLNISQTKKNKVTTPPTTKEQKVEIKETPKTSKVISTPILFPALSPDGNYLYYQNFEDGFFYKLDLTSNKSDKINKEIRIISDIIWSPDRTKAISIETYSSPLENSEPGDKIYTTSFYDFNKDLLKKISSETLSGITWSPDGKNILYQYTKYTGDINTNSLVMQNPDETNWDVIVSNLDSMYYSFGFIDSKNIFLFDHPTAAGECNSPKKINMDTGKEESLIKSDSCFTDFFVSPKSKWGTYSSKASNGFVNIDTKETFSSDLELNSLVLEDSFSKDGKSFYGFKNGDPNSIYKVDLNTKKVVKTITTDTSISTADQVIVSPDEKNIYFLIEQDGLKYLYKTQINP